MLAEKFNHSFEYGDDFQLFDSNGNQIYFENLKGFWSKSEYDSNGNIIYHEESKGFWYKKEFDLNGNPTYYENSYGGVYYDNRPTLLCNGKIIEIDGKKYELKEV